MYTHKSIYALGLSIEVASRRTPSGSGVNGQSTDTTTTVIISYDCM